MTTKPLGYYLNYKPGDGSLISKLEEKYGSHLERMSNADKLFLACEIIGALQATSNDEFSEEICDLYMLPGLTPITKSQELGLVEYLCRQLQENENTSQINRSHSTDAPASNTISG